MTQTHIYMYVYIVCLFLAVFFTCLCSTTTILTVNSFLPFQDLPDVPKRRLEIQLITSLIRRYYSTDMIDSNDSSNKDKTQ